MSKIANAPVHPNDGGFEKKVSQGAREKNGMDGQNAGGFENRVAQESGSH